MFIWQESERNVRPILMQLGDKIWSKLMLDVNLFGTRPGVAHFDRIMHLR